MKTPFRNKSADTMVQHPAYSTVGQGMAENGIVKEGSTCALAK